MVVANDASRERKLILMLVDWDGPWYKPYFMALFTSKVAKGTAAYNSWGVASEYGDIFHKSGGPG